MTTDDKGVLARWSARKLGHDKAEPQEGEATPEGTEGAPEQEQGLADAPQETPGAQMLSEEDLPDIDTLDSGSDFKAFLTKNVPDHLHKMALRKLWRTSSVLANVDGLNDYDLDYSLPEAMQAAKESAMDLASGVKRLNESEQRAREQEELRRKQAEAARTKPAPIETAEAEPAVEAPAEPPADGPEPEDNQA